MVTVYLDAKKQYKGKCDILIDGFDEYVSGYRQVHAALREKRNCLVVVRNRQIYDVFREQEKYYAHEMEHKKYSAIQSFKETYHLDIPEYITENDLIDDTSLIDVDFTSGEDFENAVLRSEFGNFFLGTSFPFPMLARLCGNINLSGLQDKNRTVLRKVFKNRLKSYKSKLNGECERYIFEQFIGHFDELKSDVAMYLLIKEFPRDFKEDILGHDLCKCMDNLGVTGSYIPVDDKLADDYRDRFKMYAGRRNVSPETLIGWVSGLYWFELDFILTTIEKCGASAENYIDRLMIKFAPLFERSPEVKLKLENIKPPAVPMRPGDDFGIDEWMTWAVDNYLPYHFWLEFNGKYDQTADEYASLFGDYIFKNYDVLVNSYPGMIYKVLPGVKDELIENNHTLFVILDNFNYKYLGYLTSRMNSERFIVSEQSPVLSMIPTETAISKRAFFSAEAYNDNGDSYSKMVAGWAQSLGVEMQYLPNIGALQELGSMDKKVYFLNFLRLDSMLHEDHNSSAQRIEVRIQKELDALVSEIAAILKRLGREKDTSVFFIADHGSTKILPEQPNGIDPKYYKDKAQEFDYRFIEVKDDEFEKTKTAIGSLCYALDRDRYGTSSSFFIAKGYNRFIRNDLNGYVHGGITPEEAIVPFVRFAYDVDMCKDPEIVLVNDNLRFSVKLKLTFLVKNYNEFPVEDVEIVIQNGNIKYDKADPLTVEGLDTGTVELTEARITKSMAKKNNEKMFVTVNYSANGRKHSSQVVFAMTIKSAQGSGTDLSDLL